MNLKIILFLVMLFSVGYTADSQQTDNHGSDIFSFAMTPAESAVFSDVGYHNQPAKRDLCIEKRTQFLNFLRGKQMDSAYSVVKCWPNEQRAKYQISPMCVYVGDTRIDVTAFQAMAVHSYEEFCGCSECQNKGYCTSKIEKKLLDFSLDQTLARVVQAASEVTSLAFETYVLVFDDEKSSLVITFCETFLTRSAFSGPSFSFFANLNHRIKHSVDISTIRFEAA
ncbi:MAG: hypothetical protein KF798_00610 [Candidatus Paracaedibacteraceae bacterium]|nr:hypothetical protein [Candidatus Paracaedibacteraceae bacterium]